MQIRNFLYGNDRRPVLNIALPSCERNGPPAAVGFDVYATSKLPNTLLSFRALLQPNSSSRVCIIPSISSTVALLARAPPSVPSQRLNKRSTSSVFLLRFCQPNKYIMYIVIWSSPLYNLPAIWMTEEPSAAARRGKSAHYFS